MARGIMGTVNKVLGADEHTLTAVKVGKLTDHMIRIRFSAPPLFESPIEVASVVRLWVPDIKQPEREHQRAYTIINGDEVAQEFDIDFAVHDTPGPASYWAAHAKVGDTLPGTRWGTGHFIFPEIKPDGYLLVGDPASLPAINCILEEIPENVPVRVYLEQAHQDDVDLPITAHPNCTVIWIPRTGRDEELAEAIAREKRDWSNWYAFGAAEVKATKKVRDLLKGYGFPKTAVLAKGYWAKGKAMGTSRGETAPVPAETTVSPVGEHLPEADPATKADLAPDTDAAPKTDPAPKTAGASKWRAAAGSELFAPIKGKLKLAALLQAIISLLELTPFVLLIEMCRLFLAGTATRDSLVPLGIAALVILLIGALSAFALMIAMHIMDAEFSTQIRLALVEKLSRVPLGWFSERNSGLVRKAVVEDASSMHYLVTHSVLDLTAGIVTPLAVLIYLFTVDFRLTLILLIPILVSAVMTLRMMIDVKTKIAKAMKWSERVNAETISHLDGLAVVRSYDSGPTGKFRTTLQDRADFVRDWQEPNALTKSIMSSVTQPATSLLLIVSVGTWFIWLDWLNPADLLPFLILGGSFGAQLLAIAYAFNPIREGKAAALRIGLLLHEHELTQPPELQKLPPNIVGRTVKFNQVTFGYEADNPVVSAIDLELHPGTLTALVGVSGGGKSTLAALLARFYEVDSGSVEIDGVDIRDLSLAELYKNVGFVFQTVTTIGGTVRENIALSRPNAPEGEVIAAARAAQLHERIMKLEHGYDTVLGSGVTLSGGEAQRLSIARVLLADPPVLILDEATAYIDPESEAQVQQALSALISRRTVLVIAHRLHTVIGADQIVVLSDGKIIQRGKHPDLLAQTGNYQELWEAAK